MKKRSITRLKKLRLKAKADKKIKEAFDLKFKESLKELTKL